MWGSASFAVAMIWQFTSAWNDFLFGVLLTTKDRWPITFALNNIAGSQAVPFNEAMASALLACLPTLGVYILLGRFFLRGLFAEDLCGTERRLFGRRRDRIGTEQLLRRKFRLRGGRRTGTSSSRVPTEGRDAARRAHRAAD